MIKRLAHRNANVQLYTLEVRRLSSSPLKSVAHGKNTDILVFCSSRTPCRKTAASRCTRSSRHEALRTPCYGSLQIEYVGLMSGRAKYWR